MQSWFEDRQKESLLKVAPPSVALKLFVDLSDATLTDATIPNDAYETFQKSKGLSFNCMREPYLSLLQIYSV